MCGRPEMGALLGLNAVLPAYRSILGSLWPAFASVPSRPAPYSPFHFLDAMISTG